AVASNELNLLCGRYPQPIERHSERFDTLDPPQVRARRPEDLLTERPDLRAAEQQLAAAKLDVSAARRAFYPSLSLDGSLGDEAYALAKTAALPESLLADLFGSLTAPLLNRSELRAEYLSASAEQLQAVLEYERAVLRAYVEV